MGGRSKSKVHVKKDVLRFSIESRLLQELGERLVSTPDVAISELIKNSYDADSSICKIDYVANKSVTISDEGHGMTLDAFEKRWMTIATSQKTDQIMSPDFGRFLTGSKGVGRFAVRVLGRHLQMTTVAFDKKLGVKAEISAEFDWDMLDETADLLELTVPYTHTYPSDRPLGTTLVVTRLSGVLNEDVFRNVRSSVLEIASPITALKPQGFSLKRAARKSKKYAVDPGFEIQINGEGGTSEGPADTVLNNCVGRAVVRLADDSLQLDVLFAGQERIRKKYRYRAKIGSTIYADIRYFPKRKGVFRDIGVDGRTAWTWVRNNHGVGIYDKGFRVPPYGKGTDDWLMLDRDNAHKERNWRSPLSKKYFPISDSIRNDTARNPMVNMITNYQLVGAVFVHTTAVTKKSDRGNDVLTPSMDRQGFVDNSAFNTVFNVIRFAVEYMANEDKLILLEEERKDRERRRRELRKELKTAIETVEKSPTLSRSDKKRVVGQYEYFYQNLQDLEEYDRRAREGVDMMGFLGVIAGFMTHEHESALWELDEVATLLNKFAKKDKRIGEAAKRIRANIENISEHVEYTRLFIRGINNPVKTNLRAKPRINHALSPLRRFGEEREYDTQLEISGSELMPAVPIPMYEGVVLNLYSNALKALVAAPKVKEPAILICAWSDAKYRYLSVSDNGVGIPDGLRNRIWDPLFTTTSSKDSPLGSGMGLGLPLVKRVIEDVQGKISIVDAAPGFTTCFKVQFPRSTRYGKN